MAVFGKGAPLDAIDTWAEWGRQRDDAGNTHFAIRQDDVMGGAVGIGDLDIGQYQGIEKLQLQGRQRRGQTRTILGCGAGQGRMGSGPPWGDQV